MKKIANIDLDIEQDFILSHMKNDWISVNISIRMLNYNILEFFNLNISQRVQINNEDLNCCSSF